jgi:hypothetical protein
MTWYRDGQHDALTKFSSSLLLSSSSRQVYNTMVRVPRNEKETIADIAGWRRRLERREEDAVERGEWDIIKEDNSVGHLPLYRTPPNMLTEVANVNGNRDKCRRKNLPMWGRQSRWTRRLMSWYRDGQQGALTEFSSTSSSSFSSQQVYQRESESKI